jgi:hypothetical protein
LPRLAATSFEDFAIAAVNETESFQS